MDELVRELTIASTEFGGRDRIEHAIGERVAGGGRSPEHGTELPEEMRARIVET